MRRLNLILGLGVLFVLLGCEGKSVQEAVQASNAKGISNENTDIASNVSPDAKASDPSTQNNQLDNDDRSVEEKPENWYLRLVAEDSARNMKTESSQLGVLVVDDIEKNALRYVGTTSSQFIDIVFENPVDMKEGLYKSVFKVSDVDQETQWRFSVKTDDEYADITLSWHGLFVLTPNENEMGKFTEYRSTTNPLISQMKLIDLETSKEVQAVRDGKVMKYSFNMDGKNSREFEWVVTTSEVNIPKEVVADKDSSQKTQTVQKDSAQITEQRIRTVEKKANRFDFSKPTMPKFNP